MKFSSAIKAQFLIITFLISLALLSGCGTDQSSATSDSDGAWSTDTVHIGYQKFGTLNILKAEGTLDKRLNEQGIAIEWIEFPAGPQLLEALNVGSIDFGHT
ncbi:hypothetical protein ACFFHM_19760 [Halalkalibacter kiskunsagensis]|uniref:Sulfonate ABC transporter substrate-binding protein n=1 Tax=Halalkalibacter kiskunsagensis TaxID=1548599 RepID=A0ABV6KH69_9BACI